MRDPTTPSFDLLIRDARLVDGRAVSIGVRKGRYAALLDDPVEAGVVTAQHRGGGPTRH